ncbi:MAG: outer membrane protein [Pseudomonadota bacterium]
MKTIISSVAALLFSAGVCFAQDTQSWSGFYVGAFAGYGDGDVDTSDNSSTNLASEGGDLDGFLGGVEIGYDWQVQNFVFGVGLDAALSDLEYSGALVAPPVTSPPGPTSGFDVRLRATTLVNLTARAGFLITPKTLGYVTGGLAYGRTKTDVFAPAATGGTADFGNDDNDRFGFVVGAGIEQRVTQNISLDLKYLYTDLGTATYRGDGGGVVAQAFDFDQDVDFHQVRIGVKYRF